EIGPLQKPRPPIWYGLSSPDSAEWAARQGFNMACSTPGKAAAAMAARYFDMCRSLETERTAKAGLLRKIVVAETDGEALEIGRRAFPRFVQNFNHLFTQRGLSVPGRDRPQTFDAACADGSAVAGSPETVASLLRDQLANSSFNYLLCEFAFG